LLVLDCVQFNRAAVFVSEENWQDSVRKHLADSGSAVLIGTTAEAEKLKDAVLWLAAEPVDMGFLHFYPQIDGIRRVSKTIEVTIRCKEALQ
jgi:hypothetical protein